VNQLLFLKAFEYAVKNSVFAPTVHPGVNAAPNAKPFRQTAPLASMLRHIQDRIQYLDAVKAYISALAWKTVSNPLILFLYNFHEW
jgi:hypothetical protein